MNKTEKEKKRGAKWKIEKKKQGKGEKLQKVEKEKKSNKKSDFEA